MSIEKSHNYRQLLWISPFCETYDIESTDNCGFQNCPEEWTKENIIKTSHSSKSLIKKLLTIYNI